MGPPRVKPSCATELSAHEHVRTQAHAHVPQVPGTSSLYHSEEWFGSFCLGACGMHNLCVIMHRLRLYTRQHAEIHSSVSSNRYARTDSTQTDSTRTDSRYLIQSLCTDRQTVHRQTVHGQTVYGQTVHGQTVHGQTVHGQTATYLIHEAFV